MSYINNETIGTFASLEELWAAYPGGGHEGDWCTVDGVIYHWNNYTRAWESTEGNVSTNARKNEWFEGDVTINHNLTVGGSLRAKRIKQPCLGYFTSEEALMSHWPDPVVGMWAVVGTESPLVIYSCATDGVWMNTGIETTGFDPLDLTEIEEAIAAIESGKYYDVSWLDDSTQHTVENYNELYEASVAQKFALFKGNVAKLSHTSTNRVRVIISYYRSFRDVNVWNTEGVITVDWPEPVALALDSDVDTLESNVTDIGDRVGTLETWKTSVGGSNGASLVGYSNNDESYAGKTNLKAVLDHMISITPKYQSANWLEDEEEQSHPGRRIAIRFTSMVKAINGNRLIKLYGNTATSAEVVSDSIIVLTFLITNSTGKSKVVYYRVTYTDGEDYCYVEKHEVPMPYYDATWATTYGGTLEQLEEFINVIENTPKALIMANNQPVVWAARRTPYIVQFAVMLDGGMRTYTVEYDSGAGETHSTYTDKTF